MNMEIVLWVILGISAAILIFYCSFIAPLNSSARYCRMEMKRSGSKREYLHWRHKLRELYRNGVPVIGRLMARFIK